MATKRRLLAITGGRNIPSRIFRIHALVSFLESFELQLDELCPKISRCPPHSHLLRLPWFFAAVAERLTYVIRARGHDVIILQRELISTMPTLEALLPGPRILDVDDAIFLRRGGRAAKHTAHSSIGVVCGNSFLADRFSEWNNRVAVIPTGVNTDLLKPLPFRLESDTRIIGWIGTSGNLKYLHPVSDGIFRALAAVPGCALHIVSDSMTGLPRNLLPHTRFTRWRPDIEMTELPRWNVGIMPLEDNDWSRGKCAFKMLQYLAAGVPVVASPVGMNGEVLAAADVGHAAVTADDWTSALIALLTDPQEAARKGAAGRELVVQQYSLPVIAKLWHAIINEWLST